MFPYTVQPLINRMLETQHDPKDYERLRPYFTGLTRDDFLMDDHSATDKGPSRLSRVVAAVGALTRTRQAQPVAQCVSSDIP
ncbi:MAG: hypothetical protein ACJ789_17030 [Thermomicrobiales bacterium]